MYWRVVSIARYEQPLLERVNSSHLLIFAGSLVTEGREPGAIGALLTHTTTHYDIKAAQLFDSRFIWGKRHLYSAIWHACQAAIHEQMISKTLSMEMLLYAAGQRQIQKAIEILGVGITTRSIVGAILGDNLISIREAYAYFMDALAVNPDISLLDSYDLKKEYVMTKFLGSELEHREMNFLEIEKAVLQRVGMLALER
jgi:KEOPS complex subunit Cgi121